MREDILVGKPGEIGARARQERERGLGERAPALAIEHAVELGLERVQVQHVVGGVGHLLLREFDRPQSELC